MGSKVKKARVVSWPSDSMLCQVQMFQTEECPAKVGAQSEDIHNGTEYSNISHIPWKLPPKFIPSDDLLVASGEESTETASENLRIATVLEAFYPHRFLIPTRPSIATAVQVDTYDDINTPTIRLTPIEEDDDDQPDPQSSHCSNAPPSLVFGLGPDLNPAASAALMMIITKEHGSRVDADLLVKLLTDPIIIKNLTTATAPKPLEIRNINTKDKNGAHSIASHLVHIQPIVPSASSSVRVEESLKPSSFEPQSHISTSGTWNMNMVLESAGTAPSRNGDITRDDYFKNLIREHGGVAPATNYKGRADCYDNNKNTKAVKVKAQKPCIFFGRGKGCKLGESCLYLHDPSKRLWTDAAAAPDFPRAKRRLKSGT